MANNNDIAQREALKRAMRLAEIKVEDAEDMQACVSDLVRNAGLDQESARIVASAYREAMMPEALEAEGIDPDAFMDHNGNEMTADFAKDMDAKKEDKHDEDMDDDNLPEHEDHEEDEGMMDSGEADDKVATLEIEVPEEDLDKFHEALEKAMEEVFGDAGEVAEDMTDDSSLNLEKHDDEDDMSSVTASRKVQNMNRSARAEREAILASLNNRTASDSFQYKAEYTNEGEHATMTMQNSEGNSLKDQNVTFNKIPVPSVNDRFGLGNELDGISLDGKVDDMNAYKIAFDPMSIPSAEGDALPEFGDFEVPTQNPEYTKSRKNTVTASDMSAEEAAEEELYNNLITAGLTDEVISNLTFAEGLDLYRQITASKINDLAKFAGEIPITINAYDEEEGLGKDGLYDDFSEQDAMVTEEEEEEASTDVMSKAEWATFNANATKEAQLFRARIKTAYGVSTKLCLAGLIASDEVEANVDLWMNDGMSVKAMLAAGTQMLRMSQTAEQRVASAHAEKNLRTASAQGVTSIPGYAGSTNNVSTDLQQALKSIFTMPRFED